MKVRTTALNDCFLIEPALYKDHRGLFLETFHQRDFTAETGLKVHFVQDNLSVSAKGVLRGLHFQTGAASQAKLVQVLKGRAQDVVVDLRADSPSYGRWLSVVLDDEERRQLFVPKGFAHGFLALSDEVVFSYKCDAYYEPSAESGIRYDDEDLQIQWALAQDELILSDKDRELRSFKEQESEGVFEWR